MKKFGRRFLVRLWACFEVLTYRTFTLTGSYNEPDDSEHITGGIDIRESDY